MRAVSLVSSVVGVGAVAALAVGWVTYEHDIVLRARAGAEYGALKLMADALQSGQRPMNSDAAVFLSNAVLDRAMKQLVGATITSPAAKYGDLKITIKDVRARPAVGLTGVALDLEISSPQRGLKVTMAVEGDLAFQGVGKQEGKDQRPVSTADFSISILKAEPELKWGFVDVSGRRFVSEVVASGLMLALDKNLAVSVPFQDELAFDTGFSNTNVVPTDRGSVTLTTKLPGKVLAQRFAVSTPLFIKSGVWLVANAAKGGQPTVSAPSVPTLPAAELDAQIAALRTSLTQATQNLDQTHDLVLWFKGSALVGLVDQLKTLPPENRTVVTQSVATTGQLAGDGKSYAELSNPGAASARTVIGAPSAQWTPNKGVALSIDLAMDLNASVHAHVNPLPVGGGAGTTFGMVGGASKRVAGTVTLTNSTLGGHSVLLMGVDLPCDSLTADIKTDGKLVIGPMRTDLFSVGLRWTMPVPKSFGQPTVVLDDLPRRFALAFPDRGANGMSIKPAHKAVEFATHITSAAAQQDGYLIAADVAMRPADDLALPAENDPQKAAIAKGLDAARQTAAACPATEQHMSVLIGDMEIGANGEIWKRFNSVFNDITKGPGDSNDLVGKNGAVPTAVGNIVKDVTKGPGENNDLVGKNGVVRSNLRNVPVIGGLF